MPVDKWLPYARERSEIRTRWSAAVVAARYVVVSERDDELGMRVRAAERAGDDPHRGERGFVGRPVVRAPAGMPRKVVHEKISRQHDDRRIGHRTLHPRHDNIEERDVGISLIAAR